MRESGAFVRTRGLGVEPGPVAAAAQVIDDTKGATIVAASTSEKGSVTKSGGNIAAAKKVGAAIAAKAKEAGITKVAFDRGGRMYHGRIKALADAAREGGLKF